MKVRIICALVAIWLVSGNVFAETALISDKVIKQFMQYDQDESGDVSQEEYLAVIQQRAQMRFDEMDGDKDGLVTTEEYDAFWRVRKAQLYSPSK